MPIEKVGFRVPVQARGENLRPFRYGAAALKELILLNPDYRDRIQHAPNTGLSGDVQKIRRFLMRPVDVLAAELQTMWKQGLEATEILSRYQHEVGALGLQEPVHKYLGHLPADLFQKNMDYRRSDMPARMLSIIGVERKPSSQEARDLYQLGVNFGRHRFVLVTDNVTRNLEPLLQGFKDEGGLSFGILDESQVRITKDGIYEPSGLITVPIVGRYVHDDPAKVVTTIMSGRAALLLGGNDTSSGAIYKAICACGRLDRFAVLVNVPKSIEPFEHIFQFRSKIGNVCNRLLTFLPSDKRSLCNKDNYGLLRSHDHMPATFFLGTGYKKMGGSHVEKSFVESLAGLISRHRILSITGAGPGPMADFARAAQNNSLTVGLGFFPTFLSANPWIDVPIYSNRELERTSELVLSASACVNLGGAHTTGFEMLEARTMGRPLINCVPGNFDTGFFQGITSRKGVAPIADARSPEAVVQLLELFRYTGKF